MGSSKLQPSSTQMEDDIELYGVVLFCRKKWVQELFASASTLKHSREGLLHFRPIATAIKDRNATLTAISDLSDRRSQLVTRVSDTA